MALFVQDERDPCLFVNTELDICIGVYVDDMLAVGPSDLTKNLLQELSKDMTMRWCMVIDKLQELFGRSLCPTPQGYTFDVSYDNVTKLCKDFGFGDFKGSNTLSFEKPNDNDKGVTDCLVGHSRCIVLTSRMQFVNYPLMSAQLPLVMKSTSSVG